MQVKLVHEEGGKRTFAVILQIGDEAMRCLGEFATSERIGGAQVTAIGAFRTAKAGVLRLGVQAVPSHSRGGADRGCLTGRRHRGWPGWEAERPCPRRSGASRRDGAGRPSAGGPRQADAGDHRDRGPCAPLQGRGCRERAGPHQSMRRTRLVTWPLLDRLAGQGRRRIEPSIGRPDLSRLSFRTAHGRCSGNDP